MCRNTNTHEVEHDADEPSPQVTVDEVWCVAVEKIVTHQKLRKILKIVMNPNSNIVQKIVMNRNS